MSRKIVVDAILATGNYLMDGDRMTIDQAADHPLMCALVELFDALLNKEF